MSCRRTACRRSARNGRVRRAGVADEAGAGSSCRSPRGSATDILARTFGQKLPEVLGPAGHRRQPSRRRRHDRHRHRRQVAARRLHAARAFGGVRGQPVDVSGPAVRHAARTSSRSRRSAGSRTCWSSRRRPASSRCRPDRAGEAKPGHVQLRLGGQRAAARTSTRRNSSSPTGIDAVHVPYKGTPEALTDTMAGRVTYFFSPISAALPQVKEGKLSRSAVVERAAVERR